MLIAWIFVLVAIFPVGTIFVSEKIGSSRRKRRLKQHQTPGLETKKLTMRRFQLWHVARFGIATLPMFASLIFNPKSSELAFLSGGILLALFNAFSSHNKSELVQKYGLQFYLISLGFICLLSIALFYSIFPMYLLVGKGIGAALLIVGGSFNLEFKDVFKFWKKIQERRSEKYVLSQQTRLRIEHHKALRIVAKTESDYNQTKGPRDVPISVPPREADAEREAEAELEAEANTQAKDLRLHSTPSKS
ncbi:MAG: hypothetical protein ABH820_01935 [Patescibacteria group bacterium]|nr:hypothetical protein [Patescibacteria group bacterium]MBU2509037.1 hypothetical protein [Patescibacteria group bacterium]